MLPLIFLPTALQNIICLWALLVCLGGIADAMLLWRQRRYPLCALSVLCFSVGYFILHVLREGTELRLKGQATPMAAQLFRLPCGLFLFLTALASAFCLCAYGSVQRWRKTHITSSSIKESLDLLPAGVCCYLEEGRCVLVNHRMNEICLSLLGRSLQNGAVFYEFVRGKSIHALSDGTAVSFRHRVLNNRGVLLHELIADDVTELYQKSEELRQNNERARQLAASMRAYGETIADTVRRQEILQAKINIHDGMNRMILATKKSIEEPPNETGRSAILKMWRAQALILCKEADTGKGGNTVSDLNALAAAIGLRLEWDGRPKTESAQALQLFLSAAREAMTNAVKHAGAGLLQIRVSENDAALSAAFRNDGRPPAEPVSETGGLKTLRRRIESAGGRMVTDAADGFELFITVPKEKKSHDLPGFDC